PPLPARLPYTTPFRPAPPRIEPDGHGAEPEERDRRLAVMDEHLLGLATEPCGPRAARERPPHPAVEPAERRAQLPLRYRNEQHLDRKSTRLNSSHQIN